MKPCIINGEDTIKIAKRLRKRCLKKQNKLESLLNMKFTSTVKSDEIKNISNFPKLTISQLKNHIVLGSYKIKLSLSYMGQLVDHGKVYFLNKNLIDKYVSHSKVRDEIESNNSKILAVLMPSRHKRGKKWKPNNVKNEQINDSIDPKNFNTYYKVFVQYTPVDCTDGLKYKNQPYRLIKSKQILSVLELSEENIIRRKYYKIMNRGTVFIGT